MSNDSVNNQQNRYRIVAPKNTYGTDQSNCIDFIGLGAYGVVYKAYDTHTKTYVALKKMKVECESDGISSSTLREITFLTQLKHDNIVRLRGKTSVDSFLCGRTLLSCLRHYG